MPGSTSRSAGGRPAGCIQLRHLDHAVSSVRSDAIVARRRWNSTRITAIAAALAVCVVGGAAALPSSPLHRAVLRAFGRIDRTTHVPAAASGTLSKSGRAGVSFVAGRSVDLRFTNPQPQGTLRIRLVDGSRVSALAEGDAGFTINRAGLEIDDRGKAQSFGLEIPRSVRDAEVRAGGRIVFAKHGDAITTSGVPGTSGAYTIELGARSGGTSHNGGN